MYILDTNICIYIIKKKPISVFERFKSFEVGSVSMSLVTYGELEFGARKSQNSSKALSILEELVNYIPVLPMDLEVARHYADIRADLSSKGQIIGNNDLWIAAHVRALGHTLVTNNTKEFDRVQDLFVENWV